MARKQKQDYDWLDALILAVVLVAVLGFVVVGSLGVLGDVYSG